MLPADVWFIGTLAISTKRKGPSVRWLLAPAVLYYGFSFLGHLSWAIFQLGWLRTSMSFDFALTSWPFPLNLSDILNYIFVLSLLIFLVRRFSAARQEEARLSQEIEAARSVQSLLIPAVSAGHSRFRRRARLSAGYRSRWRFLPGDAGTTALCSLWWAT